MGFQPADFGLRIDLSLGISPGQDESERIKDSSAGRLLSKRLVGFADQAQYDLVLAGHYLGRSKAQAHVIRKPDSVSIDQLRLQSCTDFL